MVQSLQRSNPFRLAFDSPELLEVQRFDFNNFLKQGIPSEFSKMSPLKIEKGDITVELIVDGSNFQLISPDDNPRDCILKMKTYSCKLYVQATVIWKTISGDFLYQTKPEWVLVGNLPIMTKRGHFIINGSPRVIVHQVVRSPGIYFQEIIEARPKLKKGKKIQSLLYKNTKKRIRFYGDIIPRRGVWLRLQLTHKGRIEAKLKKGKKLPAQALQRCLEVLEKEEYSLSFSSLNREVSAQFGKLRLSEKAFPTIINSLTRVTLKKGLMTNGTPSSENKNFVFGKTINDRLLFFHKKLVDRYSDLPAWWLAELCSSQLCWPELSSKGSNIIAKPNSEFFIDEKNVSNKLSSFDKSVDSRLQFVESIELAKNLKKDILDEKTSLNVVQAELRSSQGIKKEFDNFAADQKQNNLNKLRREPTDLNVVQAEFRSNWSKNQYNTELTKRSDNSSQIDHNYWFLHKKETNEECLAEDKAFSDTYDKLYRTAEDKEQEEWAKKRKNRAFLKTVVPDSTFKRKKCSKNLFETFKVGSRYDLSDLGREKINKKLGICVDGNQLTSLDINAASNWLHKLRKGEKNIDDIDHSQNRRIRTSGELLQTQFENGIDRLKKLAWNKLKEFATLHYNSSHSIDLRRLPDSNSNITISEGEKIPLSTKKLTQKNLQNLSDSTLSVNQLSSQIYRIHRCFALAPRPPYPYIGSRGLGGPIFQRNYSVPKQFGVNPQSEKSKYSEPPILLRSLSNLAGKDNTGSSRDATFYSSFLEKKEKSGINFVWDKTNAGHLILTNSLTPNVKRKSELNQINTFKEDQGKYTVNELNKEKEEITQFIKQASISIKELLNTKAINGALREFFGSNPLSQYMDQTNPLAEITHKRRISSLGVGGVSRESAGMAIRGIHPTHYGRICPIETPEGKNAGLVNSLAFYAKIDDKGFIKTPYYKVVKGQVQEELGFAFFSAKEEGASSLHIAPSDLQQSWNNVLTASSVPVRVADNLLDLFKKINPYQVDCIGISPIQMISVATSLIPFLEHNDANRALMGSNMQRQAVPLMIPERPLVGTGLESLVVAESGHLIQSQFSGFVSYVSAEKIVVEQLYSLLPLDNSYQGNFQKRTKVCSKKQKKGSLTIDRKVSKVPFQINLLDSVPCVKALTLKRESLISPLFQLDVNRRVRRGRTYWSTERRWDKKVLSQIKFRRQVNFGIVAEFLFLNKSTNKRITTKKEVPIKNKGENIIFSLSQICQSPRWVVKYPSSIVAFCEATPFISRKLPSGKLWYPSSSKKDFVYDKAIGVRPFSTFIQHLLKPSCFNRGVALDSILPYYPIEKGREIGAHRFQSNGVRSYLLRNKEKKEIPISPFKNQETKCSHIASQWPRISFYKTPDFVTTLRDERSKRIDNSFNQVLSSLAMDSLPGIDNLKKKKQSIFLNQSLQVSNYSNLREAQFSVRSSRSVESSSPFSKQSINISIPGGGSVSRAFPLKDNRFGKALSATKQACSALSASLKVMRKSCSQQKWPASSSKQYFLSSVEKDWIYAQTYTKSFDLSEAQPITTVVGALNTFSGSDIKKAQATQLVPFIHTLKSFDRSNQDTCLTERALVNEGDWVQKGDILTDCSASDRGELAVGKNILIAYTPWEGYNFEDAIVISERLVKEDIYTSIHIERYDFNAQHLKEKTEWFTNDLPGISSQNVNHLDECGLPKIGSFVKEGDILVGKIQSSNKKPTTPYERLLCDILGEKNFSARNASLYVPKGVNARVIKHRVIGSFENKSEHKSPQHGSPKLVHIFLGEKRPIQVGDKMSGRHGNKGVIATILPRQDMPYLADGTPIDIILNPLGVPSRMNVGQIFECVLGLAGTYLAQHFKITAFDELYGVEASQSLIYLKLYQARLQSGQNWLFQVDFPGKTRLIDGRSGESFDQWITVGKAYMLKLIHMVSDKIHARDTGPYALVTQQPLRGRAHQGGQRLGEMEVWALEAFGAAYTLQELLTKKSDDVHGRKEIAPAILPRPVTVLDVIEPSSRIEDNKWILGHPEIFKVLICELQALCLDVGVYSLQPQAFQRIFLSVVE